MAQWRVALPGASFSSGLGGTFSSGGLLYVSLGVVPLALHGVRFFFRHRRAATWVASTGWSRTVADPTLVDTWHGAPFDRGSGPVAMLVLQGTYAGRPATAFECWYNRSATGRVSIRIVSVVVVTLPAALPELAIVPETTTSRIAGRTGRPDLQFESEAFNREWHVTADDERLAHDVVHPRLMEWLLCHEKVPYRIEGSSLLTWRNGPLRLKDLDRRLVDLTAVADSVPEHVWQRFAVAPPRVPQPRDPRLGAGAWEPEPSA